MIPYAQLKETFKNLYPFPTIVNYRFAWVVDVATKVSNILKKLLVYWNLYSKFEIINSYNS